MQNTPRRTRLRLLIGVVAVVLAGVGLSLGGNPAGATTDAGTTATPYNQGGEWWDYDGCSVVADSGWWGDFHHACVHHDGCYRNHWAGRDTCDWWFWNDMRASCAAMFTPVDPRSGPCNAQAYAYFWGVSVFGASAYDSGSSYIPMDQYAHYA